MAQRKRRHDADAAPPAASPPQVVSISAQRTPQPSMLMRLPADVLRCCIYYLPSEVLAYSSVICKQWRLLAREELAGRHQPFLVFCFLRVRWSGFEEEHSKQTHLIPAFSREHIAKHIIRNWEQHWAPLFHYDSMLEEESDQTRARGVRDPAHYRDPIARIYNRMRALKKDLTCQRDIAPLRGPFSSFAKDKDPPGRWEQRLQAAFAGQGRIDKGEYHRLRLTLATMTIAMPLQPPPLHPLLQRTLASEFALLLHVLAWFEEIDDIMRCRRVCRAWYAAVHSPAGRAIAAKLRNRCILEGYSIRVIGGQEAEVENRYLLIDNYYTAEQRAWEIVMGDGAAVWRQKLRNLWADHPQPSASEEAETSYLRHVYREHCNVKSTEEIWRECVRTAKEDTIARIALLRERYLQRRNLINRTSRSKFITMKQAALREIFRETGLPDSLYESADEHLYHSLVSFGFAEALQQVQLSEWLRIALMGIEYQGSWYRWLFPREHDRLT